MRRKVLLVYPTQGFSGIFIQHAPISLIYAAAELVKNGIDVEVFDNRLHPRDWRDHLRRRLSDETMLVGISVMSGKPIENAIEIGRFVKSVDPGVRVAWGGPHSTFSPETAMQEPSVDFSIAGYGSVPLFELVSALLAGAADLSHVRGLSFRRGEEVVRIPEVKAFEKLSHREIPYHLISDYRPYGNLDQGSIVFSMFSVLGCPYKCTFCSSPAQYKGTPGKIWVPLEVNEVVDHIAFVVERYGADFIYFIDDDSFVNLAHVEGIIDEVRRRGIKVKLGFRGARINEVKRMSHAYLTKLAEAGTDIMHIGVESGSDRVLRMIKKGSTVADIIECNQKLAQHPEIKVGYNFMVGVPSETLDEVKATRDLMLRLIEDNPRCVVFTPNKFQPRPGTEMFESAVRDFGYKAPTTLADWMNVELEADYALSWYPEGMERFIKMMVVTSYFVDGKIFKFSQGSSPFYRLLRAASALYAPVARLRLKHGIDQFNIEFQLYQLAMKALLAVQSRDPAWFRWLRALSAESASPFAGRVRPTAGASATGEGGAEVSAAPERADPPEVAPAADDEAPLLHLRLKSRGEPSDPPVRTVRVES